MDALVRVLRGLEQNNGKIQGQSDSDTRSSLGAGYRDDLFVGIRVVDQIQRKEGTGQRKNDSTDSQIGMLHSWGLVQPHTKGLRRRKKKERKKASS